MPTFSMTGQLRFVPSWTDAMSTTDVVDSVTIQVPLTLSDGDGAGEADAYWRDVRTVAATTTDTVSIDNLSLSIFGGSSTLDLAELKLVYVRNLSETLPLQFRFGYPTAQETSDIELRPGAFVLLSGGTGLEVEGAAPDSVIVENTGASAANYEIVLVGVQA